MTSKYFCLQQSHFSKSKFSNHQNGVLWCTRDTIKDFRTSIGFENGYVLIRQNHFFNSYSTGADTLTPTIHIYNEHLKRFKALISRSFNRKCRRMNGNGCNLASCGMVTSTLDCLTVIWHLFTMDVIRSHQQIFNCIFQCNQETGVFLVPTKADVQ